MADVDAVVIGSGAGGLAAALAMQQQGKQTLVLEQHYLPGGWCHSFDLGGFRFSPGVHYIGECAEGGRMREVYEGLGVSRDLQMCELNPDGLDHILVKGERFDIPKGRAAFEERLARRFPDEAKGIRRYLDTTEKLNEELKAFSTFRLPWDLLTLPWKAPATARWGLSTLQSLFDATVRDPHLRAILAGQAGDHGLPPSMVPAPVHCATQAHYFGGGYFPRGGGAAIPRAFIHALKRAGGQIRMRTSVDAILTEKAGGKQRAIGVRLRSGEEIRASTVVSNADPHITFEKLIGRDKLSFWTRQRLAAQRYSVSCISLFLAADVDPRAHGMDSGNMWFYETADVDGVYKMGMDERSLSLETFPGFFLTCTTLKDPTKMRKGVHTFEAFAFLPYSAFHKWAKTSYGERPEDYKRLKADLQRKMLRCVSKIIPGIEEKVVFADLGTPLTNKHYVAASFGNLYGTEKSRFQVGPFAFPIRTEIDGLLMCGASTVSHGVMGATLSGLFAAAKACKVKTAELLRQKGPALEVFPCERPESWPDALKKRMKGDAKARAAEVAEAIPEEMAGPDGSESAQEEALAASAALGG